MKSKRYRLFIDLRNKQDDFPVFMSLLFCKRNIQEVLFYLNFYDLKK